MRRVITAREQIELFAPWRTAAPVPWPNNRINPDPSDPESGFFTPNRYRPDMPTRPKIDWEPDTPEHPMLSDDMPVGNKPTNLYRGISIDLHNPAYSRHPDLNNFKQIYFGGSNASPEDLWTPDVGAGNKKPDPNSPEGQAMAHHLLNFIQDTGKMNPRAAPPTDLGRHWSTDPHVAEQWALAGNVESDRYLQAIMTGQWGGLGEDPERTNNRGEWPQEKEVTMIPGAQLGISGLHIRDPSQKMRSHGTEEFQLDDWHNLLKGQQPHVRTAGRS